MNSLSFIILLFASLSKIYPMDFFDAKNLEKFNKDSNKIDRFALGQLNIQVFSAADPATSYDSLLHVKYLFQRMLPKMPRDYIMRQVFDENQCCMTLNEQIENSPNIYRIIGALLYRPCFERKLVEIVFLAVDSDYHINGYGSFLFNCFKEVAKLQSSAFLKYGHAYKEKNIIITDLNIFDNTCSLDIKMLEMNVEKASHNTITNEKDIKKDSPDNITEYPSSQENVKRVKVNEISTNQEGNHSLNLLTYADNSAIGFFKKQGFSLYSTSKDWIGYIKDYEGGTLVECKIYNEINYLKKKEVVEKIRNMIFDKMKKINTFHVLHGENDKKEYFDVLKQIKEHDSIEERTKAEFLVDFLTFLTSSLQSHPSAWPFQEPVSIKDVPDYFEIIKSPMDLSTILNKTKSGVYITVTQFIGDVLLMCENCFTYNNPETQYYKCAENMKAYLFSVLNSYKYVIERWGFEC